MSLDPERIADRVDDALDKRRLAVRSYLAAGPRPPGQAYPSDEQFEEFVQAMIKQWPPISLDFPVWDGQGLPVLDGAGEPVYDTRVVSPWITMLALTRRDADGKPTREQLVEGGEALLARHERVAARAGPLRPAREGETA